MGFAYLFEFFVLNIFKAYKYKPKVLKNRTLDNVFGAALSQAIFIPFTAVFLTISKSGWPIKILGGIYFSLIEILFMWLGVYKHNWWKTVYTLILIPIYFKWSDVWYKFICKKNDFVQFFSFFLMIMVTETNLFLVLTLLRKVRFGLGKYHGWTEHFIISPLYSMTLSFFTAFSLRKNNSGAIKVWIIVFATCLNQFFLRKKLLKNKLQFFEYILIRIVMVFVYGQYKEWVFGREQK